jgi:hemolysin III
MSEPVDEAVGAPRDVPLGSPGRPSWRGRIHLLALTVAVPLLVALSIDASHARARAAVIVYAVGLCSMLAVSTIYHRWVHTIRARAAWRRADHATIFMAIAGTFTALALTILSTAAAITMLVVVWCAAAIGAFAKAAWFERAHRLGVATYIAIGWAGVALGPAVWQQGGLLPVMLLFAGGVIYTAGAIGFGRRWPTLRPATFGYHEVWHAFTVAAAGLHLAAIWTVTT